MRSFARLTGFKGSPWQWATEYRMLCEVNAINPQKGIDTASFCALVDDESDRGCYCTDEELADVAKIGLKPPKCNPLSTSGMSQTSSPTSPRTPRRVSFADEPISKGEITQETAHS